MDLWKQKSGRAFDASPIGAGYECYRTWEGLILGQIVIVKTSFLDPLFAGLPVKIVQDWREVTPKNMKKWHQEFQPMLKEGSYVEKLKHEYWMSKINAIRDEYLGYNQTKLPPEITFDQGE